MEHPEQVYTWSTILRKLFDIPGVVTISGPGKCGKTDFALKISEDMRKILSNAGGNPEPIVHDVASNIDTEGVYPQISDLVSLKQWLYSTNRRKAYILDEANEHLSNLRSMSSQNVGFTRLLPQATKAHCRLIVIGHSFKGIDKSLLNEAWCKGMFYKENLKNAQLFSRLLPRPFSLDNISPTTITFDPYAVAPFTEKPEGNVYFKEADKQLLWDWANGKTCKDLGLANMQLNRKLRKYVYQTLENEHHV